MGTPEDQCVDPLVLQFLQITLRDLACQRIMEPPLLHQGDKQRTGLSDHLDLRVKLMQDRLVDAAPDRALCADHADPFVFGLSSRHHRAGADDADHRDIKFLFHRLQSERAGCVAGDDDGFHFLLHQKTDDLP